MSVTPSKSIKLYLTETEPCSYLDGKRQRMVVVDPMEVLDKDLSTYFSSRGFRRSGNMTYRPNCNHCSQCISVRIPVDQFKPSRNQRRVARKNSHLHYKIRPVEESEKYFDLYYKYQQARHSDGIMCDPSVAKYKSFIESDIADTKLLVIYDNEHVVSVSVIDLMHDGLSAVYTFFDPDFSSLSLGTFSILTTIELCRKHCFEYVYLGFWIEQSNKMSYKKQFQPLQGYINDRWQWIKNE
ncbi:MAG: arginyltransferase [Arenicella sp.]